MIRGNIFEIKTLSSGSGTTKGVDADVADKVTEENLNEVVAFAKWFVARLRIRDLRHWMVILLTATISLMQSTISHQNS